MINNNDKELAKLAFKGYRDNSYIDSNSRESSRSLRELILRANSPRTCS